MEKLSRKKSVEQITKVSFRSFSQCYYYFYFSAGYFCMFYNRIRDFLSNEHRKRICQPA